MDTVSVGRRGAVRGAAKVLVAISLVVGVVATPAAPAVAAPTTWSIRPSTSPPGPPNGLLTSIACPTATKCFAVGSFVLQQWNGTAWSLVKNVIGPGAAL